MNPKSVIRYKNEYAQGNEYITRTEYKDGSLFVEMIYEASFIPKLEEKNYKRIKIGRGNSEYTSITDKEEVDRIKSIIEKEEKEFFEKLDNKYK